MQSRQAVDDDCLSIRISRISWFADRLCLEERQIGQRSYPTRYVVLYQDQALRRPGYRLVLDDGARRGAQDGASGLARGRKSRKSLAKERTRPWKKASRGSCEALTKKKDEAEKKKFKKGQADLEKELGF